MYDTEFFLRTYSQLNLAQYMMVRDAGFSQAEAEYKRQNWFTENIDIIKYSDCDVPATSKQLEYIAQSEIAIKTPNLTFGEARHIIREHAKLVNLDEKYVAEILKYEKKGKAKPPKAAIVKQQKLNVQVPESIVQQNQLPEIDSSRFEEDDDENKFTPEFFERIKKSLNSVSFAND